MTTPARSVRILGNALAESELETLISETQGLPAVKVVDIPTRRELDSVTLLTWVALQHQSKWFCFAQPAAPPPSSWPKLIVRQANAVSAGDDIQTDPATWGSVNWVNIRRFRNWYKGRQPHALGVSLSENFWHR